MKKPEKRVACDYIGSIYGGSALDWANYLGFDANLTPCQN